MTSPTSLWLAATSLTALLGAQDPATKTAEPALGPILAGGEPTTPAELRLMQDHVQALLEEVLPSTVQLGGGTGVLVDGGFVLTAGHVIRTNGRKVSMTLHDGRRIDGETLGVNMRTDTGLVRIVTAGDFPARPMGRSADLKRGAWCLMFGHPSGAKDGRSAPARLGRVLSAPDGGWLVSDCPMQSGDSGGPLFDMTGAVIGINSRISNNLAHNMHVPIDAFHGEWKKLLAGEVVEAPRRGGVGRTGPSFGIRRWDRNAAGAQVASVASDSPAAKAGVEVGDVITKVAGRAVANRFDCARALRAQSKPEFEIEIDRGDELLTLSVTMPRGGRR